MTRARGRSAPAGTPPRTASRSRHWSVWFLSPGPRSTGGSSWRERSRLLSNRRQQRVRHEAAQRCLAFLLQVDAVVKVFIARLQRLGAEPVEIEQDQLLVPGQLTECAVVLRRQLGE